MKEGTKTVVLVLLFLAGLAFAAWSQLGYSANFLDTLR